MSASKPDIQDRMMKWMGVAMVACCEVPIAIALFLGRTTQLTSPTVNSAPNSPKLAADTRRLAVIWVFR